MIYYEYYNKNTKDIIQFWYDKTISKYNEDESDYISMQELQAINKKCQELRLDLGGVLSEHIRRRNK